MQTLHDAEKNILSKGELNLEEDGGGDSHSELDRELLEN